MYVLLHPATMSEIVAAYPELLKQYVNREAGSEEVVKDLFLEHAKWSSLSLPIPKKLTTTLRTHIWKETLKKRKQKKCLQWNLFWIDFGRIRQNVIRLGGRRGWKEIDAVAMILRQQRIARSPKGVDSYNHDGEETEGAR